MSGSSESEQVLAGNSVYPPKPPGKTTTINKWLNIVKTPTKELACSRHVHRLKTKLWTPGHAACLALLLSQLLLTTVRADGTVVAWGGGRWASHPNYPSGLTNVVAVAAAFVESIALRADGTVIAWADDNNNPIYESAGLTNVISISAGLICECTVLLALKDDGTVIRWPWFWSLSSGGPEVVIAGPTNIVAVSAPHFALRADGTVVDLPEPSEGFAAALTNVVEIAAAWSHSLALTADGNVVASGIHENIPGNVTNVVAVACRVGHSLALTSSGQVVAWGDNSHGQTNVPPGLRDVVAVAAGDWHSLALRADGTVVAWGQYYNDDDTFVPATVPEDLGVVSSLTSAGQYWLAIIGSGPPVLSASLNNPTRSAAGFSVSVPTQSGRVYALEYKNSLEDTVWTPLPLVAGTGRERTLTDPTANIAQRFYRVRRW